MKLRSTWGLELEGDSANADLQYQKLWRTLQRFARETQVSAAEVQWTRLAMKEPPTWSRLPPAQVSMSWNTKGETLKKVFEKIFMARGEKDAESKRFPRMTEIVSDKI